MGRVALDDSCFDGVGKDAAEETNGTRGRSSAASDDGLSAQLLGFDRNPRLGILRTRRVRLYTSSAQRVRSNGPNAQLINHGPAATSPCRGGSAPARPHVKAAQSDANVSTRRSSLESACASDSAPIRPIARKANSKAGLP
jgi:hypothetical protein